MAVPARVDVPATVDVGLPQASGAAARDTALEAAAEAARTARPAQRSACVAALQIDRQQRCRVMTDFAPSAAMLGTMPGARERGRPRTAWMDNIKTWTGLSVEKSIRMTEDRDHCIWRKYVHGVANPRIEDG